MKLPKKIHKTNTNIDKVVSKENMTAAIHIKKKRLSFKEKGFIKDIAKGKTGTQAALDNYDTTSETVAASIASENLRKPKIIEALADAFPDELLKTVHMNLLKAGRLDQMTFPLQTNRSKEISEEDNDDDEIDEDTRVATQTGELMSDQDIIELLASVGCTVKRIVPMYGLRHVYFWSPDNMARDKALDKAYKIRGSYAAEKREVTGANGEPLFNDEHKRKSDAALEDLLG